MVSILICDERRDECTLISEDCKLQVAQLGNEELNLSYIPDDSMLVQMAEEERPANLLYYDFQEADTANGLRLVKKEYGNVMVMLITSPSVSPLDYLRPGTAPDALIFKPIQKTQLKEINREFMQSYFNKQRADCAQESFLVDTRVEKLLIPYSHIYYFEAREKKLFLRTRHKEYAFYGTIDSLEKSLPSNFQRCHRSYIVNLQKLLRIIPSENYLELLDQMKVPVSRSYKNTVKEVLV